MTVATEPTTVWLLDGEGENELYCGWRVHALFRGSSDLGADDLAFVMSEQTGACLHVHAEFDDEDGRQVVLRWSTRYARTLAPARPAPRTLQPAAPASPGFELREQRTEPHKRRALGSDSGTFVRALATSTSALSSKRRQRHSA